VSAGPVGRGAGIKGAAGGGGVASAYCYAQSKGLFAGISFEGSVVAVRGDVNTKFYGKTVGAKDLLLGRDVVGEVRAAGVLYEALEEACGIFDNIVAPTGSIVTEQCDMGEVVERASSLMGR